MFRKSGLSVATLGPGDRVVMKPVSIAVDHGQTVDIATGLQPSDKVIDNPADFAAGQQ